MCQALLGAARHIREINKRLCEFLLSVFPSSLPQAEQPNRFFVLDGSNDAKWREKPFGHSSDNKFYLGYTVNVFFPESPKFPLIWLRACPKTHERFPAYVYVESTEEHNLGYALNRAACNREK